MSFAFYKARHGGLFSRVISFWTRSPYSHSETVFSQDATMRYVAQLSIEKARELGATIEKGRAYLYGKRLAFSASERDKCVRVKLIHFDPERWEFIGIESAISEHWILRKCEEYVGCGYDYLGLGSFILKRIRLIKPNPRKMWCSETTEMVAHWLGLCDRSVEPPSPGALYRRLTA